VPGDPGRREPVPGITGMAHFLFLDFDFLSFLSFLDFFAMTASFSRERPPRAGRWQRSRYRYDARRLP
jgi:hypothetical protein